MKKKSTKEYTKTLEQLRNLNVNEVIQLKFLIDKMLVPRYSHVFTGPFDSNMKNYKVVDNFDFSKLD